MENEEKMLTNENEKPNHELLESVLKQSFIAYQKLADVIVSDIYNMDINWNYYKDGKSWLCKVENKKRTIFWLSVWKEYFEVTFYFTEKFDEIILGSKIREDIKKQYMENNSIGKLKPLTIKVDNIKKLKDIYELVNIRK